LLYLYLVRFNSNVNIATRGETPRTCRRGSVGRRPQRSAKSDSIRFLIKEQFNT
jgi:hypothetical protein